jgi:hypothetical protein
MIRLIAAIAAGVLTAAGGAYAAQSLLNPASAATPATTAYDGN